MHRYLAAALAEGGRGVIAVYDAGSGALLRESSGHHKIIYELDWSPREAAVRLLSVSGKGPRVDEARNTHSLDTR